LGRFFCQLFGDNAFPKNTPKTKIDSNAVISQNFSEFGARTKFSRFYRARRHNQLGG